MKIALDVISTIAFCIQRKYMIHFLSHCLYWSCALYPIGARNNHTVYLDCPTIIYCTTFMGCR